MQENTFSQLHLIVLSQATNFGLTPCFQVGGISFTALKASESDICNTESDVEPRNGVMFTRDNTHGPHCLQLSMAEEFLCTKPVNEAPLTLHFSSCTDDLTWTSCGCKAPVKLLTNQSLLPIINTRNKRWLYLWIKTTPSSAKTFSSSVFLLCLFILLQLGCCGFTNYTDFVGSKFEKESGGSLPPSCCRTDSAPCSRDEAERSTVQARRDALLQFSIRKKQRRKRGVCLVRSLVEMGWKKYWERLSV